MPPAPHAIAGVPTSVAAFAGRTGSADAPIACGSFAEFERVFGADTSAPLRFSVAAFFANGGTQALIAGSLSALNGAAFNLLCIPPDEPGGDTPPGAWAEAAAYCAERRTMLIADAPAAWAAAARRGDLDAIDPAALGVSGVEPQRSTAVYFPRLRDGMPASGAIAGIWARTDAAEGVWKAPAGTAAGLLDVPEPEVALNDEQGGVLNARGINALRTFSVTGSVVWGARTLRSAAVPPDPYVYVPVRRLALFVEESARRGIAWADFEPNGEPLWSQLRSDIGAFLIGLQRQGAFYGSYVRCDTTTMTQADIDAGNLHVVIGIAPVRPAEYVEIDIRKALGRHSGRPDPDPES